MLGGFYYLGHRTCDHLGIVELYVVSATRIDQEFAFLER